MKKSEIFAKVIAVIDSCRTLQQCLVARKFLHLANKHYLATTVRIMNNDSRMLAERLNKQRDKIYANSAR